MENQDTYTSFYQQKRIAHGNLETMLLETKKHIEQHGEHHMLIFADITGKQIDFDFRGSPEEILARAIPPVQTGRGRPKLGVTSREVTLLPRHWQWLEAQPSGASATLRRLIEVTRNSSEEKTRQTIEAMSRFMTSMTGDAPNYEEATRALYARDWARFLELIADWHADIYTYLETSIQKCLTAQ